MKRGSIILGSITPPTVTLSPSIIFSHAIHTSILSILIITQLCCQPLFLQHPGHYQLVQSDGSNTLWDTGKSNRYKRIYRAGRYLPSPHPSPTRGEGKLMLRGNYTMPTPPYSVLPVIFIIFFIPFIPLFFLSLSSAFCIPVFQLFSFLVFSFLYLSSVLCLLSLTTVPNSGLSTV